MARERADRVRGRRRLALLTGGALIALLALFLALRSEERAPAPARAEQAEPASIDERPSRRSVAQALPADPGPLVPIIDEILVEKPEVCEGEENLITIRAHTPSNRENGFLRYLVDTRQGPAIPLRSYLRPDGEPLKHIVQVYGRDGVSTSAPVPAFKVKTCNGQRLLNIQVRQVANSVDELELVAQVRELGGGTLPRPEEYRWQFGDGDGAITKSAAIIHRFAPPRDAVEQETWHYLARCEAKMPDGREVVGRVAVELRNFEFENLHYKGVAVLSTAFTPRFPHLNAEGRVEQRVRLYHHRSSPVRLTGARVTYEGTPSNSMPAPRDVSPGELLGTDVVPPGDGVEAPFTFDARAYPGVAMVNYELAGTTSDGRPVSARFSIMRPPPEPNAKTGERIVDPAQIARVVRAQERLGKKFVSDDDLAALEHEGAFDDLPRLASALATQQRAPDRGQTGPGKIRGTRP